MNETRPRSREACNPVTGRVTGEGLGERQFAMIYFSAWYRKDTEGAALDAKYPDWVVYAMDEPEAHEKVLACIGMTTPERGYKVYLHPFQDEDAGTIAFATARQSGQALI